MKKLTQEDRDRIKQNFFNTKFGSYLLRHKTNLTAIFSIVFGIFPYSTLMLGTFIPDTWSILIPYPISLVLGHTLHGYTQYPSGNHNILYILLYTRVATHHLLDLSFMWISYWIMVYITKSFIYPSLFCGYVIAIHEYGWWFSYIIAHSLFFTSQWELLYFSNHLTIIYALIIFFYIPIKGWSNRDFIYIGLIVIMYILWVITGFHINWDFNGATPYQFDLTTILTEISSWGYTFLTFFLVVDFTIIKKRWL